MKSKAFFYVICLTEFTERLAYFGLFTALVLILKKNFHLSDNTTFAIFGLFAALSYSCLLLGGLIADKLVGIRQAILIGFGCYIISTFLLSSNNIHEFYYGLTLLILGSSLLKVNLTTTVGLITKDPALREKNFTLFYVCMNAGAVLGPILFGIISSIFNWNVCFYFVLVTMLLVGSILLLNRPLANLPKPEKNRLYLSLLIIIILSLIIFGFISFSAYENIAIVLIILLSAILFFKIAQQSDKIYRKKIIGLLLVFIFSVFFFACSLQVASSITLFIQRDINRTLLGWTIPTTVFSSLDPLFVVVMAPAFIFFWNYLKRNKISAYATDKISLGIFLASLAYLTLFFTAKFTEHSNATLLPILLIIIVNLLLGAGEICLAPSIFACVAEHSPPTFKSTMMGSWYLFTAFAGYIASELSKMSSNNVLLTNKVLSSQVYAHAFLNICLLAFVMSIVVLLSKRLIKKLLY